MLVLVSDFIIINIDKLVSFQCVSVIILLVRQWLIDSRLWVHQQDPKRKKDRTERDKQAVSLLTKGQIMCDKG